jgi:FKBP-type peptidyl-prolyl cis-trans isomerase FkpA
VNAHYRQRILSFVFAAAVALGAAGCDSSTGPGGGVDELQTIDLLVGSGAVQAEAGKIVAVHYTGWLYEESAVDKKGQQFDSSISRGQPYVFILGARQVIKGWDEGIVGMRVGGKRRLLIPPDLAYGSQGYADIPPNATLVFDVELMEMV